MSFWPINATTCFSLTVRPRPLTAIKTPKRMLRPLACRVSRLIEAEREARAGDQAVSGARRLLFNGRGVGQTHASAVSKSVVSRALVPLLEDQNNTNIPISLPPTKWLNPRLWGVVDWAVNLLSTH